MGTIVRKSGGAREMVVERKQKLKEEGGMRHIKKIQRQVGPKV